MSTTGQKIRELRAKQGYTQQELADILSQRCGYKVSRSTLGMWETDDRVPQRETLEAIADLFNIDIDWLLGRKEQKPSTLEAALEIALIARAGKKMTAEQRALLLKWAKLSFPEAFDE